MSRGAYSDFTVRAGVISGMSNGTALTGGGGIITPSTFDETDLTGDGPEDYIDPHNRHDRYAHVNIGQRRNQHGSVLRVRDPWQGGDHRLSDDRQPSFFLDEHDPPGVVPSAAAVIC